MIFLYLIFLVILAIYGALKYHFSFWRRHGIQYLEPELIFGNIKPFVKKYKSLGMNIWDLYNQTKRPFIGVFMFFNPGILIRDVDLVKKVLITDFNHFYNRGLYLNKQKAPLAVSLTTLKGKEWKDLRMKLNPLFSSGRMKSIFPTIAFEADRLERYFEARVMEGTEIIEIKDVLIRYALDVIGSVFYGNDTNTVENPNQEFRRMFKLINSPNFKERIRMALLFIAPKMLDWLNMDPVNSEVTNFFLEMIRMTIKHREDNKIYRNDFMQVFIELREQDKGTDNEFTVEEIAANCILFYNAGTVSTSGTVGYLLYETALQPDIMQKLQSEIDDTLAANNGEFSYDMLHEMTYLDLCVKETLRKYPGLPHLNRECSKDYKLPNTEFTIKNGTPVVISVMGLHYNPKNFEDPERFDPERFRKGKETYNKDAYIPFGDGPRQCLGKLFYLKSI
ncbi:probable cytochrome P450 6d4 [Culicoides brevitarsis]|uniref:probable cytochrome P450 6d4 n=1 Tax=Culicoides brevitarsis TaxID=469753 RepID=UPI00307B985F